MSQVAEQRTSSGLETVDVAEMAEMAEIAEMWVVMLGVLVQ